MRRRLALVLLFLLVTSCRVGGCAAGVLGDVVGETGDAFCDRRFVPDGGTPGSFCQEVIDTVAVSQFQDDCREKHRAKTGEGRCPSERRLGGCKILKQNDDGSDVYDWYYDVTDLEADAGVVFVSPARTEDDVRALCADRKRYGDGASFTAAR